MKKFKVEPFKAKQILYDVGASDATSESEIELKKEYEWSKSWDELLRIKELRSRMDSFFSDDSFSPVWKFSEFTKLKKKLERRLLIKELRLLEESELKDKNHSLWRLVKAYFNLNSKERVKLILENYLFNLEILREEVEKELDARIVGSSEVLSPQVVFTYLERLQWIQEKLEAVKKTLSYDKKDGFINRYTAVKQFIFHGVPFPF